MKKFITAFDGLNILDSTIEYAIHISKLCDAHLVGVFLEPFYRHSYSMADIRNYEGEDFTRHIQEQSLKDENTRKKSIEIFRESCQNAGINFSVHRDRNIAIEELVHESIYADLLIISPGETLSRYTEQMPSRFIRNLLGEVHCPVLLVPDNFRPIEKFILLYDGSPSSVFAIKSFSYIFEAAKETATDIITVKPEGESLHLPDNKLIREFTRRHFPLAQYLVLQGNKEEEITSHLKQEQKYPVVILGAYGRSSLSMLFKKSMAVNLLHESSFPLFIAHH